MNPQANLNQGLSLGSPHGPKGANRHPCPRGAAPILPPRGRELLNCDSLRRWHGAKGLLERITTLEVARLSFFSPLFFSVLFPFYLFEGGLSLVKLDGSVRWVESRVWTTNQLKLLAVVGLWTRRLLPEGDFNSRAEASTF